MAQKLNVYGQFAIQAYDLWPGQQHNYVTWGLWAENGVVSWATVKPFPAGEGFPGEKILEITDFRHEATEDGSRRMFYSVKNTGGFPVLAYAVYYAWTDVITQ